jgi:hypothetical protein
MKLGAPFAFLLAACIASGAEANDFDTPLSREFSNRDIEIANGQAVMEFHYFIDQQRRRTVWSRDSRIGRKKRVRPGNGIYAHATFVIRTTRDVHGRYTVNINADKVHITSWYPLEDQDTSAQCRVYEDDACRCTDEKKWNICRNTPAFRTIREGFVVAAQESRIAAKNALQQAGVTVTENR